MLVWKLRDSLAQTVTTITSLSRAFLGGCGRGTWQSGDRSNHCNARKTLSRHALSSFTRSFVTTLFAKKSRDIQVSRTWRNRSRNFTPRWLLSRSIHRSKNSKTFSSASMTMSSLEIHFSTSWLERLRKSSDLVTEAKCVWMTFRHLAIRPWHKNLSAR